MMKTIRIGTRDSELAMWQATTVQNQLEFLGFKTELVPVKSIGDLELDKPIYELGVTGVFTRELDVAMIKGKIDIAVHSMKDVPTVLPQGMIQGAVMKRGLVHDVLVFEGTEDFFAEKEAVIATGSLRRKAAWLNRYPSHEVVDLRGNINTRMQKLEDSDWNGAIFAAAGLKRIGLKAARQINLDWMIPAPGQGAVLITVMESNTEVVEAVKELNDEETALCTKIERDFLNRLEGGCTSPIGAHAKIEEEQVHFEGVLFSKDGQRKLEIAKSVKQFYAEDFGLKCADQMIERGAKRIMLADTLKVATTKIYSTKKLSESQKELVAKGYGVEDSDFIKIRFNRIGKKQLPVKIDNLVFSSKNAVESLLTSLDLSELEIGRIYCVGRRTKKLIEQKIGPVNMVAPSASALAEKMKDIKGEDIWYLCGDKRLDTLPNALAAYNTVHELEMYKTLLSPKKMNQAHKMVLFYSPSGVQSFVQENDVDIIAVCIGETTAEEARKNFKEVLVSKVPNVPSMIELANSVLVERFQ